MPYIPQHERAWLEGFLARVKPKTPGQLTYCLYFIVDRYIRQDFNFARANEALGALHSVDHEWRRRWLDDYERSKLAENGDV